MLDTTNLRSNDNYLQEGVALETDAIALNLSDDDVARAVGNRVEFSKGWWNAELNLDMVQKNAERIWQGLVSADVDLYDYQEPYEENRIFMAIETLTCQAVGRPPQPVVTEAYDTDASRNLARNVEKVLLAQYRDLYMHSTFQMLARHLLSGFRYAVLKYRWDNTLGRLKRDGTRTGGIVVEWVRPDKVVFQAGATKKDNIPMIAEYMQDSWEDLTFRFPKKKDDIMRVCGKSFGTSMPLTDLTTYLEVHFTGNHPDTGESYEGVTWRLDTVVMDKIKNPNFNYDEFKTNEKGELEYVNFFEKPYKPYIVLNHLNQGKYIVDTTSLVEQTKQLQRHLERRGRQIDENASAANAGTIYNSSMVSEENVSKLIGDPNEKVMAKGDVRMAASRLPSNKLEDYVIEDKVDIRGAIDTIFGANAPIVGEKSGNKTLGQDRLSIERNSGRLDTLVKSMEDGADRTYKAMVQLMKVFFTEEDMIKYTGEEGRTSFIQFSNASIESGIGLVVKDGSIMPDDPIAQAQKAQMFAQILDPLTLAEEAGFEDPKLIASRIFTLKSDPSQYGEKYLDINPEGQHDPDGVAAIQQISQGQMPQVPENPSTNYVDQLKAHISSPAYQSMSPVQQKMLQDHAMQVAQRGKQQLGATTPTPQNAPISQPQQKPGFLSSVGNAVKNGLGKTLFQ